MPDATAFSPDFDAARARFRGAALALGWRVEALPIAARGPGDLPLSIEVASIGPERPERAVVVSSGLHGVEGFFGSAVQAALLEEQLGGWAPASGRGVILLHALNPFGFAWLRRVNEDNIDLNRNFLLPGESYDGAPDGYAALDGLLNPKSPPPRFELFLPRAFLQIARHGMPALKNAVAGGQYAFPTGIMFGGAGPSETQRLLAALLAERLSGASRVLHVDFHTGLGVRADYKLFVDHARGTPGHAALGAAFGADRVEAWDAGATSYKIRGGLGSWCRALLPHVGYDVLAAEYGTEHVFRVIRALRRENRSWHHGDRDGASAIAARSALRDVFAPTDRDWRDRVIASGVGVVTRALEVV